MLTFLTESLREALCNVNINRVYELRLRAGKPVVVNYGGEYRYLGRLGIAAARDLALTICYADIGEIVARASEYSVYSVTEQLRRGFLTGACGERIGLAGVFVYEEGKSFTVKDVTSLNIRVPHEVIGCGEAIFRACLADRLRSVLLISPPGRGKTTILRDLARLLGAGGIVNVLIHDERNEISAAEGDRSLDVGPFCDVIRYSQKQDAFTAAVRALRPDVLITDELVSDGEMCAAAPRRARAHLRAVRRAAGGGDRPRRRHLRRRSAPRPDAVLKVLLCIAAFGLCIAAALLLTRRYRRRKEFFYALNLFNERLYNEVSYLRAPLSTFIEKYDFGGDFQKMLREKREGDFGRENYGFAYLTADERKFLGDYFRLIGKSDAASQRTYLAAARAEAGERRRLAEEEYKKYFSLYSKLGVLAGLILVILIV